MKVYLRITNWAERAVVGQSGSSRPRQEFSVACVFSSPQGLFLLESIDTNNAWWLNDVFNGVFNDLKNIPITIYSDRTWLAFHYRVDFLNRI